MGLLEFSKLPVNTLVGADWKTFNEITRGRVIDPNYRGKYRLTKAVCRLLSILKPLQDKKYEKLLASKPLEHDPMNIKAAADLPQDFFEATRTAAGVPTKRVSF